MTERLVVVGSLNMDLSVTVPRLPEPGETVPGADAVRGAGGKGANQAVAAARLGARVSLVGLLGDDAFGGELRAGLAAEGVDDRAVRTLPGTATGLALIVVQQDGENTITLSPGANRRLDPPTLEALLDDVLTDDPLTKPAAAVLLQLEVPQPSVLAAARRARAAGALTVLNAAPRPDPGPQLAELLGLVDVLVVNETEAAGLLGLTAETGTRQEWAERAQLLRAQGPATAVVTLGAAGAVAAGPTGRHSAAAFPVRAVDTVGAGDAFCAQLTVALSAGRALPEALRRACAAGALAATRTGAQRSLPTLAEVDALLNAPPLLNSPPRPTEQPKAR
ncbi:ribokinase [Kitasatospora sp. MAP12-15]|uniref:ribokinase n=1 Tax=unclassified Kitasatospora TaxID=2633591 RepID=UPI00247572C8|nr:ribokinase [Kitasatospora sp. MAP12-44]MDH6115248.1 ribokinase [Kitasatospora sp. MAP12-44]